MTDHRKRSPGEGTAARTSTRRRALIAAAVIIALIAAALVGVRWWTARADEPVPGPTPTATPTPTGASAQALLMQVRNDDLLAVGNVLVSSRGQAEPGVDDGAMIGVQPRLLVDVPGAPQTTMEATAKLPDAAASQVAIGNQLGVRVFATWTLDRLAFSGLVDSIGGIYVDVATPVTFRTPAGTILLSLPKGIARLDGPQAATYALALLPGEAEAGRMARYQEVVRQVLLRLPPDKGRIDLLLGSLGALSRVTVPVDQLSDLLLRLRADVDGDKVTYRDLPVTPAVPTTVRLNFVAAASLVTELLTDVAITPGPDVPVRVLVIDGVGRPGVAATARAPLEAASFVYLSGGAAPKLGYTESLVLVPDDATRASGAAVATALRLPATAVKVAASPRTTANIEVILGADYLPPSSPSPEPTLSPEASPRP